MQLHRKLPRFEFAQESMLQTIERRGKKIGGRLEQPEGLVSGPWVLCGDFNTVRCPSEMENYSRINKSMTDFSNFI